MDICLYASHYQTAGATRNGYSEEMWSRAVVTRAVEILRGLGFNNIYTGGLTGHEITQHQNSPNLYDVCISNHFNSGNAMLLYNANRNNPRLAKMEQEFNHLMTQNGIINSGKIHRSDLAMLNSGSAELYLLEWADCNKANELAWLKNTEARAKDLANLVKKVFLDGKNIDGEAQGGQPTPPTNTTPWYEALKGATFGSNETIIDAYEETGIFTYTNAPHALSIYPDIDKAMQNQDADTQVFYNNGEALSYWGVVRTDKYDYLLYDRNNGQKGCVSIRNKMTGRAYGVAK